MLLLDSRKLAAGLDIVSTFAALAIGDHPDAAASNPADGPDIAVYLLGNWPVAFGIVLVADRLSAMMLVLTGVLACAVADLCAGALAQPGRVSSTRCSSSCWPA